MNSTIVPRAEPGSDSTQPSVQNPLSNTLLHLVISIVLALLSFGVFLLVREGVEDKNGQVLDVDHSILLFMHAHASPVLTQVARVLAWMGSPIAMGGLALVGILIGLADRRLRGAAWTLPLAVLGGGALIQGVKMTMQRQRPDLFVPLLRETGYSFPSGHSLIAMVVYGLLGFFAAHLFKKRAARVAVGVVTALFILLIGVSRVYAEVHYPTDVLAGWSLGFPWLIGCQKLHEKLTRHYRKAGEPALAPPAPEPGESPRSPA